MGLYDGIKDILTIAQKADNIELYKKLLDLGQAALDLQAENQRLLTELSELKKEIAEEKNIVRHKDGLYITLADDDQQIHYCSTCWGNERKLIQLNDERCFNCDCKWFKQNIR